MKKYNICKFWSRFYSPNRALFFSPRVRAGGLLFEGYPRGNVWNYFRSPGNITFVTTNIVTFVGIVTYDTFVAANEERIFEDRLAAARLSLEREEKERQFIPRDDTQRQDEDALVIRQEREIARIDDQIEVLRQIELKRAELEERRQLDAELKEAQEQLDQDTVSPELTYKDVKVERHSVMDLASQRVRMSLFQMVYSFYSYKSALLTGPERDTVPDMDQFYAFWNEKYNTLKLDDSRVAEFKLPNWTDYPNLMKSFCFLLHEHAHITRLTDFETLYHSVDSYEIKRLLRLWLYDNWFQLKGPSSPQLFKELVHDSRKDRPLLSKYMSVITQDNPRALLFFPLHNKTPTVPLDTVIDLLDTATRSNDSHSTIKLISLLKHNCYMDRDSIKLAMAPTTPQQQNKCYRYLSQNKRLTEILESLL